MRAVVEIWFESLIPFLLKDSHIVHWGLLAMANHTLVFSLQRLMQMMQNQKMKMRMHCNCSSLHCND